MNDWYALHYERSSSPELKSERYLDRVDGTIYTVKVETFLYKLLYILSYLVYFDYLSIIVIRNDEARSIDFCDKILSRGPYSNAC